MPSIWHCTYNTNCIWVTPKSWIVLLERHKLVEIYRQKISSVWNLAVWCTALVKLQLCVEKIWIPSGLSAPVCIILHPPNCVVCRVFWKKPAEVHGKSMQHHFVKNMMRKVYFSVNSEIRVGYNCIWTRGSSQTSMVNHYAICTIYQIILSIFQDVLTCLAIKW